MRAAMAVAVLVTVAACSQTTDLRFAGAPAGDGPEQPFSGEHVDPTAPADVRDSFGGPAAADPEARPRIVYPLDGAMLAGTFGGMRLQWASGGDNRLFRVTLEGRRGRATVYAGEGACPSGRCEVLLPDELWGDIATANPNARVQLHVDATAARDAPVARSEPVAVVFTPDDLRGDLVYWSSRVRGVVKVPWGQKAPLPFLTNDTAAGADLGGCVGCHSMSGDGCVVAFGHEKSFQYAMGVAHLQSASTDVVDVGDRIAFSAVNPAGTRILTAAAGLLTLRDAAGMRIGDLPPELVGPPGSDFATHPEWTPDGGAIVFTRASVDQPMETSEWTESGDIAWLPFDGDTPGAARVLVARTADESHFYPHVSPDGRWVVFDTGRNPGQATYPAPSGNLSSYAQVTGRLRLVAIDGGTPIELARATHGTDVTASRARFAPFMQRSGTLMFLSFSSKLDYGWVLEQAALNPNELGGLGRGQLWMAAIDLALPGDPSFAPFWLPMQDVEDGNYEASWLPPGASCPP